MGAGVSSARRTPDDEAVTVALQKAIVGGHPRQVAALVRRMEKDGHATQVVGDSRIHQLPNALHMLLKAGMNASVALYLVLKSGRFEPLPVVLSEFAKLKPMRREDSEGWVKFVVDALAAAPEQAGREAALEQLIDAGFDAGLVLGAALTGGHIELARVAMNKGGTLPDALRNSDRVATKLILNMPTGAEQLTLLSSVVEAGYSPSTLLREAVIMNEGDIAVLAMEKGGTLQGTAPLSLQSVTTFVILVLSKRKEPIESALLDAGLDPNRLLLAAVMAGSTRSAEVAQQHGASLAEVTLSAEDMRTVLGAAGTISRLVAAGLPASPAMLDRLATQGSVAEVAQLLQAGADANAPLPPDGLSVLQRAAALTYPAAVGRLFGVQDDRPPVEVEDVEPALDDLLQPQKAAHVSHCPVCLKFVERVPGGCMYMKHVCAQDSTYYHAGLYERYADKTSGTIAWCTLCGRICKGHGHYPLVRHDAPLPAQLEPFRGVPEFYGESCAPHGGGDRPEKLARVHTMLVTAAAELRSGAPNWDRVVEAAWDAPFDPPDLTRVLRDNKWDDVDLSAFPSRDARHGRGANGAPPLPAWQPSKGEALPSVADPTGPSNTNVLYVGDEGAPLIRFHHRMSEEAVQGAAVSPGAVNHHASTGVSAEGLTEFLKSVTRGVENGDPETKALFGRCVLYQFRANASAREHTCTAVLRPEEVASLVPQHVPEDVYEAYAAAYARVFAPRQPVVTSVPDAATLQAAAAVGAPMRGGSASSSPPSCSTSRTRSAQCRAGLAAVHAGGAAVAATPQAAEAVDDAHYHVRSSSRDKLAQQRGKSRVAAPAKVIANITNSRRAHNLVRRAAQ